MPSATECRSRPPIGRTFTPGKRNFVSFPIIQHIEKHVGQRIVAQAALRLDFLHELFEWKCFVCVCADDHVACLRNRLSKGRIARQICPQSKCIREKAQGSLDFRAHAAGDKRADDKVLLAGIPHQQDHKPRKKSCEERHSFLATEFAQAREKPRRNNRIVDPRRERAHWWTGEICLQIKRGWMTAELAKPVVALARVSVAGKPLPLPMCIVGILYRLGLANVGDRPSIAAL